MNTFHLMLDLVKNAIEGAAFPKAEFSEKTLKDLFELSSDYSLANIVGYALINGGVLGSDEYSACFKNTVCAAVFLDAQMQREFGAMSRVFKASGIEYIPLKGAVLKQYYPESWFRSCSDIDILVHKDDLEKAAEVLENELSYVPVHKGTHDISFFSKSSVHIELHYELIEKDFLPNSYAILKDVWDTCDRTNNECRLSGDMFYFYHIAHMAKHYLHGGCGVRPFIDTWILKKHGMASSALLEKGGLKRFDNAVQSLTDVWFDNAKPTTVTNEMEKFIQSGGTYGNWDNYVSIHQVVQGNKFKYFLFRVWLPYEQLKFKYPFLDGRKYLLPPFEVKRWIDALIGGQKNKILREVNQTRTTTDTESAKVKKMLDDLGLL